jgi:carbohydrate diacid regulator
VVKFAGELAGYVWEKDKFELNIGIDSAQSYDMHEAYVEAHRAWTAAAEKHEQIICYEDISLELLISNVPTEIKLEYLKKVFKDMDYNDVCENIALLKALLHAV